MVVGSSVEVLASEVVTSSAVVVVGSSVEVLASEVVTSSVVVVVGSSGEVPVVPSVAACIL